ncbi:UDP-N-acetylmuramoyl-L-alanyl-D-glutamate--2,6-diaminopimelate ligase [Dietzia lutea]|uniref:Mur ligase family protein n=1 Tax=Dietzia lutea TaxID=546160 RepID=UPI002E14FE42
MTRSTEESAGRARSVRASPDVPQRAPITAADLSRFLGTPVVGGSGAAARVAADLVVVDITDDSRSVSTGHAYLALPGSHHHGLDFEAEAAEAGAVVAISDRPSAALPTLVVGDPRAVSGPLSAWFHGCPSHAMRVFGVTGTNGKTSAAHFLEAGLAAAGESSGLISGVAIRGAGLDLRPVRTTPEAPMLQHTLGRFFRGGATACAMEVSSHAIDQGRIDGVRFRTVAFTNLGHDHLDYHHTMEEYYRVKASLFTSARADTAVVSVDDPHGRRLAAESEPPTWTCSVRDVGADVYAEDIVCDGTGSRFTARTPLGAVPIHLRVLGPHQVPNALVALTGLLADDIDPLAAAEGISRLSRVPGRCEPVHAGQSFTALVDYMHNEPGQRALLPYLRSMATGRLILVIGATGGRDRTKRRPLGRTAASFADLVIVTDESPEDEDPAALRAEVLAGAREAAVVRARETAGVEVMEEPDRGQALALAVAVAGPGDVVVVAGRGSEVSRRYGPLRDDFDDRARLLQAILGSSAKNPGQRSA